MARHQNGEGELVLSLSQGDGMSQKLQLLQLSGLCLALVAVVLEWPLVSNNQVEGCCEALDIHQFLLDVQEDLS